MRESNNRNNQLNRNRAFKSVDLLLIIDLQYFQWSGIAAVMDLTREFFFFFYGLISKPGIMFAKFLL